MVEKEIGSKRINKWYAPRQQSFRRDDNRNTPNLLDRDDVISISELIRKASFPAYKSLTLALESEISTLVNWVYVLDNLY